MHPMTEMDARLSIAVKRLRMRLEKGDEFYRNSVDTMLRATELRTGAAAEDPGSSAKSTLLVSAGALCVLELERPQPSTAKLGADALYERIVTELTHH